jgi:hypothetical protein
MNDQLKFVFSNAEKITESEFKSNCKLSIKCLIAPSPVKA